MGNSSSSSSSNVNKNDNDSSQQRVEEPRADERKKKKKKKAFFEGKTAFEWNQRGVALNSASGLLESLDCYLRAVQAAPDEWLGYQNAGHCAIQLEWFEGSQWFHERVRELDRNYEARPEKDKCGCLDYSRRALAKAKKNDYVRLWRFEEVLPAGFDLSLLAAGEQAVDPCWTLPRNEEKKYLLRVGSRVLEFETVARRQHACTGMICIAREQEARLRMERVCGKAAPGHAVLRGDVLQHLMSFFTDDWRELAALGLVCKAWLKTSCHNGLWKSVWLKHKFEKPLTAQEVQDLHCVESFGTEGFLKRLLLTHSPLVYEFHDPITKLKNKEEEDQRQEEEEDASSID